MDHSVVRLMTNFCRPSHCRFTFRSIPSHRSHSSSLTRSFGSAPRADSTRSTFTLATSRRAFHDGSNGTDDDDTLENDTTPWSADVLNSSHTKPANATRQQQQQRANETITRLFQSDAKRQALHQTAGRTRSAQTVCAVMTTAADEADVRPLDGAHSSSTALATVDVVEQDLLDDAFLYFPPLPQTERGGEAVYVPGQQIVPPGHTRYRVDVQYQGNDFDGWWKSTRRRRVGRDGADSPNPMEMRTAHHAKTVLEEALAVAVDVHAVAVVAGAIPEAGVSARRLCCHADLPSRLEMQPRTILQRAAMWLEKRRQPLAVLCCHPCRSQDFHARHSGVRRVYVYRMLNRIAPPLFDAGLQWHVDRHLDVDRMQRFAKALEGTMDYGYFADPKMAHALRRAARSEGGGISTGLVSAAHHTPTSGGERTAPKVVFEKGPNNLQRAAALPTLDHYGQRVVQPGAHAREYHRAATNLPTIRTIDRIDVVRQDDEVLIWFVGKSFLRHQIRNMVSLLKAVGHGLWDELELQQALKSGFEPSRKRFKRERLPPAPVYGLTLWDMEYPQQHRDDVVQFVDSGPFEEVSIAQDV